MYGGVMKVKKELPKLSVRSIRPNKENPTGKLLELVQKAGTGPKDLSTNDDYLYKLI